MLRTWNYHRLQLFNSTQYQLTNMSLRVVFGIFVILAVVSEMIDGCDHRSGPQTEREEGSVGKVRSVETPIIVGESGFGLLLRPRNTKIAPTDTEAEEIFRKLDTNNDGMVDAAEWVNFSKKTSVWDFVKLLDYANKDEDEAVSVEEFLSVQTIKIDQLEERKDDVAATSS